MPRDGPASRAVSRLDAAVGRAVAGDREPVLAFSGGLGSLVLAAMVRKRGDLRCVVVGFRDSADVQAARVAESFLDYRVSIVQPTRDQFVRVARSLSAAAPRLAVADVLSLIPLVLVEERYGPHPVLSGFGLTARTAPLRDALAARRPWCPGLGRSVAGRTRAPLLRIAETVGLPQSFVLAAPRTPGEGSGIGPRLRDMAHARGVSLARFLRER